MKTQMNEAPPRPDLPARKKTSPILWVVLGVAIAGIVAGIVALTVAGQEKATPAGATDPVQSIYDGLEPGEAPSSAPSTGAASVDWAQAVVLTDEARDHVRATVRFLNAYDVYGAADELEGAGDASAQVSDLTAAVPSVSEPFGSAADHLYAAADALRGYRLREATRELEAGNADVERANAALRAELESR